MKKSPFRVFAAILVLSLSLLCCPAAFAETDTTTFATIPYAQANTLQVGQRIAITGTPNYSAATSNASCNFFGFDTAEGVWYIAIGKTSVAAFQKAMPAQQMTLYGMYAGTLEANGMPILDIQQGAVQVADTVSESVAVSSAGQAALDAETAAVAEAQRQAEEQAAEKAAAKSARKQAGQKVWIPRTGHKYHSNPYCSNMKNPSEVDLQTAINWGYGPCKRCY
nr:MAG TPA: Metal binding domain of Ada [Caudoviricetes sp.]